MTGDAVPVMLFCPVYTRPDGSCSLEPRTRQAIEALDYPGLTVVYQDENPHQRPGQEFLAGLWNHLHQFQAGRARFLAGAWAYLLVVESDMLPPADVVQRLLACGSDVAYAPYMLRHGRPVISLLERYAPPARNVGDPLRWGTIKRALREGRSVIEVSGQALGCTLIARRVLEAVDFRIGSSLIHCDWYFTEDVYRGGFSQRADLMAICGHIAPDGAVLWPDWTPADYAPRVRFDDGRQPRSDYGYPTRGKLTWMGDGMKVIVVRSFVAQVDGRKYRLAEGDVVNLPEGVDWLRAGLVQALDEPAPIEQATVSAPQAAVAPAGRRRR